MISHFEQGHEFELADEDEVGNTYVVGGGEVSAHIIDQVDADGFFELVVDRVGSL